MIDKAKQVVADAKAKMTDTVAHLDENLKNYRAGKANTGVFNQVMVSYYGNMTPLPQTASITAPDAKTMLIQPWDKSLIHAIEKAIIDANLGLTPQNNGEMIRCTVPALTEERRKELIKKAKTAGENAKIVVRNSRRDGVDLLKKAQKNEGLSEDAEKEAEEETQKLTDRYIKSIDDLVATKEKEIMTV